MGFWYLITIFWPKFATADEKKNSEGHCTSRYMRRVEISKHFSCTRCKRRVILPSAHIINVCVLFKRLDVISDPSRLPLSSCWRSSHIFPLRVMRQTGLCCTVRSTQKCLLFHHQTPSRPSRATGSRLAPRRKARSRKTLHLPSAARLPTGLQTHTHTHTHTHTTLWSQQINLLEWSLCSTDKK